MSPKPITIYPDGTVEDGVGDTTLQRELDAAEKAGSKGKPAATIETKPTPIARTSEDIQTSDKVISTLSQGAVVLACAAGAAAIFVGATIWGIIASTPDA